MGFIRVLSPETARLIAAGEVIERPASALRELIDNAIDSGASELSIRIEAGGIAFIGVVDDGAGMDGADLELSILPHATSKIANADDLLRTRSLGFRGEALASIAAAARLEIVSKDEGSPNAYRLVSKPGSRPFIESCAGRRGTSVAVSGLFEDFPARKRFLKRPQAEAALCRQIFEDKAAAHPGLAFRYESGSAQPTVLLPSSRLDRLCAIRPDAPRHLLHAVSFSGAGFEGELLLAGPAFSRPDRRLMQAFVNRRRVQDWSILGALERAFAGYLPGGLHPFAFLFLEIDPSLVDFNIHPAKKEIRLKDPDGPRRAVYSAVQNFLSALVRRDPSQALPDPSTELGLELSPARLPSWPQGSPAAVRGWEAFDSAGASGGSREAVLRRSTEPDRGFRYLGRALGPFLLFERGGSVWFLDQHAAHERILFDALMARPPESQRLLVPEAIEPADESEDEALAAAAPTLNAAGFRLELTDSVWTVTAAPPELAASAANAVRELVRGTGDRRRAVFALAACRSAVKDGDLLEKDAATALIAAALELKEPRCPHGRPIWTQVTREQLYRLVRREI